MKPVIDFRVDEKFSPYVSAFLEQLWIGLAEGMPGQDFIFLTEDPAEGEYPPNISIRDIKGSSFGWLDQKRLLTSLEEWRADVYTRFAGDSVFIMRPGGRLFSKKDLQQPATRIVFSEHAKAALAGTAHFVKPVLPGVIASLPWAEAESIRVQHTGGKEFFLFTGDIAEQHRLVELLKAFSLFKKRQQTNMQLVIAGYVTAWTESFEEKLSTYKYRADVIVLKEPSWNEVVRLAAAAYGLLYPSVTNVLPLALLLAMQSGQAIITSDIPIHREVGGGVLWVDNNRLEEGFAQSMMLLYKDEDSKQALVRQAREQAEGLSREKMKEEVWALIEMKNEK